MSSNGLFRKRDLAVVILVIVSLYLTMYETPSLSYSLEPAWFVDNRKFDVKNPRINITRQSIPDVDYALLPPIITDLEGDFSKEMVLINKDLYLMIFDTDVPKSGSGEIYHPRMTSSVPLQNIYHKTKRIAMPVAMSTGYIAEYEEFVPREQVIVVVLDDWTVVCYDAHLNTLWEKVVGNKSHDLSFMSEYFSINEVSIHISPLNLRRTQENLGAIIVGASMRRKNEVGLTAEGKVKLEEGLLRGEEDTDAKIAARIEEAQSDLEHFNIYAMEGTTGHVIWRHDGAEVVAEQYSKSLPQHAYSLDMQDLMTHTHHAAGINHWTVFRQSLMDELPHFWNAPAHTTMRIAHFVRRHFGHGAERQHHRKVDRDSKEFAKENAQRNAQKKKSDVITTGKGRNGRQTTHLTPIMALLQGVESEMIDADASLPHTAAEHTVNPNVLVVHTSQGLEVVSLQSGTPITSLALSRRLAYDDLDGDGVVDAVLIVDQSEGLMDNREVAHHFANRGDSVPHCTMVVLSGLPVQSELFRGSVCPDRNTLHDAMSGTGRAVGGGGNAPVGKISYAPPLVMRKLHPHTLKEDRYKDVVVAIHSGVVSSYSGDGELNWQRRNGPTWSALIPSGARSAASVVLFDSDAWRVDDEGTHDNLFSNILIMGDNSMKLFSREGDELTSVEVPQLPVAPPILGDFDNDGVTDVIIVTEDALLGFHMTVTQSNRVVMIGILILSFLAVIAFVSNIQNVAVIQEYLSEDAAAGGSSPSVHATASINRRSKPMRRGGNSILRIIRSTDETHDD